MYKNFIWMDITTPRHVYPSSRTINFPPWLKSKQPKPILLYISMCTHVLLYVSQHVPSFLCVHKTQPQQKSKQPKPVVSYIHMPTHDKWKNMNKSYHPPTCLPIFTHNKPSTPTWIKTIQTCFIVRMYVYTCFVVCISTRLLIFVWA